MPEDYEEEVPYDPYGEPEVIERPIGVPSYEEEYQETYDPYGRPERIRRPSGWSSRLLEAYGRQAEPTPPRREESPELRAARDKKTRERLEKIRAGTRTFFSPSKSPTLKWLQEKEPYGRGGKPRYGPSRGEKIGTGIFKLFAPRGGMTEEQRQALYFGKGSAAGRAVMPGMIPAAQAHAPGMVPAGRMHMLNLSGMRQLTMPGGLRPSEQAAWQEIRANGDIDTRKNVVTDLKQQGFSGQEAASAVTSLESKGHIEKTGLTYDGSPEYTITISMGRK